MRVSVILGGHLRKEAVPGPQRRDVDLDVGSTVADLVKHLEVPEDRVKMVFVNAQGATFDRELHEEDRVGLFPPELAYNTFVSLSFRREFVEARGEKKPDEDAR